MLNIWLIRERSHPNFMCLLATFYLWTWTVSPHHCQTLFRCWKLSALSQSSSLLCSHYPQLWELYLEPNKAPINLAFSPTTFFHCQCFSLICLTEWTETQDSPVQLIARLLFNSPPLHMEFFLTKPLLQMHKFPHWGILISLCPHSQIKTLILRLPWFPSTRNNVIVLAFWGLLLIQELPPLPTFVLNSTTTSSSHRKHLTSLAFLLIRLDKYWTSGLQLQPLIHEARFDFYCLHISFLFFICTISLTSLPMLFRGHITETS